MKLNKLLTSLVATLVLTFAFTAFTSTASAQTCTISGHILTEPFGDPVGGIEVGAFIGNASTPSYSGTTEYVGGYYTFNIPAGTVRLKAANVPQYKEIWWIHYGDPQSSFFDFDCQTTGEYFLNWEMFDATRGIYGKLIDDDTQGGIANRTVAVTNESTNQTVYTITDSNGNFTYSFTCGSNYTFDVWEFGGDNVLTTHYSSTYTQIDCADADNNVFLGFISFD